MVDMWVKMNRIIDPIHSTVPEELWPEILRKIDGPVPAAISTDDIDDCDDAEGEYGPLVADGDSCRCGREF
jgi:hypothetical protein